LLSQGSRFWTNLLGSCRWPQNAKGTPLLNALQRIPEPPSSQASDVGVAPGEEEHQLNSGHKHGKLCQPETLADFFEKYP